MEQETFAATNADATAAVTYDAHGAVDASTYIVMLHLLIITLLLPLFLMLLVLLLRLQGLQLRLFFIVLIMLKILMIITFLFVFVSFPEAAVVLYTVDAAVDMCRC